MNQDSVWQAIRYSLIAIGGFLAGKGYVTAEQVTTLVGALGMVFPIESANIAAEQYTLASFSRLVAEAG